LNKNFIGDLLSVKQHNNESELEKIVQLTGIEGRIVFGRSGDPLSEEINFMEFGTHLFSQTEVHF